MRNGFTTGSCAAAASKAAAYMLLSGKSISTIRIETPKGIPFDAQIINIQRKENFVSCAIVKDGGDDPDVTTGAHIVSTVSFSTSSISIDGGIGIGRVTKPGLDQPVGEAAINHVPREMILKEVEEVCALLDYREGLNIVISCPEGEEISKNTFNSRLGIIGGISILGTSGIVEPMSSQALLDTIYVELKQKRALGYTCIAISPGNYGLDFMKEAYGYDLDRSVKCSNYIGDTIDMAIELGYSKLLLTGHIGKLVKVAGGMMNTHSKMGDCRMELLTSAAIQCGCSLECAKAILNEVNTEQGIVPIQKEGKVKETMSFLLEKMMFFLEKRACGKLEIGVILYSNVFKELARSNNAISLLEECRG